MLCNVATSIVRRALVVVMVVVWPYSHLAIQENTENSVLPSFIGVKAIAIALNVLTLITKIPLEISQHALHAILMKSISFDFPKKQHHHLAPTWKAILWGAKAEQV